MKDAAVATFATEAEAQLGAQRLAAVGIRSVLVPLGGGAGVFGATAMLPHELRVLAVDAARARAVLQERPTRQAPPQRRYRKRSGSEQRGRPRT